MGDIRSVTIGVLGSGKVSSDLVCSTLNDQFAYGPADADGYFAPSPLCYVTALLCANEDVAPGVREVWQWALRCEIGFELITGPSRDASIVEIAETLDHEGLHEVCASPVTAMVAKLGTQENPMLVVVSEDGTLDEDAEWAAARALEKDIPVYDLSRALLQLDWNDLANYEAPVPVEEEADGQLALVVEDGPETVLTASEAAAINRALTGVADFGLSLQDLLSNGVTELLADVNRVRSILAPRAEEGEAKPRSSTRQYLEVFDEETGEWKRAGRGRPKKGAQTRLVPPA